MERNNNYQCNPHRYEKHLSIFGKKVLQVLINKWKAKHERDTMNNHYIHQQAQSRKVLKFKSSTSRETPTTREELNPENEVNASSFNFNLMVNNLPNSVDIATSTELVKSVEYANNTNEIFNVTTDDLIRPAIDGDEYHNIDIDNKTLCDDDLVYSMNTIDNDINKNSNVNWNNMFDTELLPEFLAINEKLNGPQNINTNQNTFQFLNENNNAAKPDRLNEHNNIDDHNKGIEKKKVSKRKNQTKITDAVPKKVKKIITEVDGNAKNNFRKHKYTKTVKKWLNYVHPDNGVEKCIINTKERDVECAETAKEPKIITDTFLDKPKKKIVQAKLANEGGIMKFKKPQDKIVTDKLVDSMVNDNRTEEDIIKEKKSKANFVTPIKSQIPVKTITYEICTVDTSNVEDHENKLSNVQNTSIFIVLVYSNGFSQLNNHNTDDTSVPEGIIVDIDEVLYYFKGPEKKFKNILKQILESNKIVCYEGKHILMYLQSQFDVETFTFDVIDIKIGSCLLEPDNPPENFTELQRLLSHTPQFTIATEYPLQKIAWYISVLKECEMKLSALLMENSLWTLFVEIEMRLLPIIADMELRGVRVDMDKLKSMEDLLLNKMKIVELQCHKAAGKVFQINSAVQVRAILYDELQLDTKCNVKIRETICKGAKSTSETMLRSLVSIHPLPRLILEYRHLHKAHATFLSGVAQHVKDGIVRPSWVQTAAATGRIASNNPNLQAIPRTPFSLVVFSEEDDNVSQVVSFRSVYTPRAGHTLVAADFKHVECRVLARAAADAGLLRALSSPHDLFKVLAAQWLNKPESDISAEDRERTKRIVYASLYGAGARKLMDILGVSYEQTLAVIASFNRTFPSLKLFGRCVVSRCEQSGGRLSTPWGRVRVFKNITSDDFALRSHAERQAVNFLVQADGGIYTVGSAADLCKIAMIRTCEGLRSSSPAVRARLVLQIHDELVWEVGDSDLGRAAVIIKEVMENCGNDCGMAMTLPVAISVGRNWGEMHEYTGMNSN